MPPSVDLSADSEQVLAPRYSLTTLNAWNTQHWDTREPILRDFDERHRTEILAVQELRPEVLATILQARPELDHVDETKRKELGGGVLAEEQEGWLRESNIFWDARVFDFVACGAERVGIAEDLRRLFWVRLRERFSNKNGGEDGGKREVIVCTAHLTWQGSRADFEPVGGQLEDPRKRQMRNICVHLKYWTEEGVGVLFCGDFNAGFAPKAVLRALLPRFQVREPPPRR